MEVAGAVEIFKQSFQKHKLVYSHYLSNGDALSLEEVVECSRYSEFGILPEKVECVGHIQKRLGTSLRSMVKQHKGTAIPLSGKGKLTDKVIDSFQNFYGLAIRKTLVICTK